MRLIPWSIALAIVLTSFEAWGGKPPKDPPNPPPPPDGGTIYFGAYVPGEGERLHGIAANGSGLTALAEGIPYYGTGHETYSEPSEVPHACALHGQDEHWFLDVRPIEPPEGEDRETYPNGVFRNELFAVCANGAAVQLTDAPDLEPDHLVMDAGTQPLAWTPRPEWVAGETFVSYLARRWADGEVVEWGLYVLEVDPENLDDHVAAGPTWIPVEMTLYRAGEYPPSGGVLNVNAEWSPDGASFVFRTVIVPGQGGAGGPLIRADHDASTDTWSTTELLAGGAIHDWSPVADRILVKTGGYLSSLDPYDPTDIVPLLPSPISSGQKMTMHFGARWSPSGTHIAYGQVDVDRFARRTYDIYVAGADGSRPTNITKDLDANAWILGWGGD